MEGHVFIIYLIIGQFFCIEPNVLQVLFYVSNFEFIVLLQARWNKNFYLGIIYF